MMSIDLSLLPQGMLASIGGPGELRLKVRKRLAPIEEEENEIRENGSTNGNETRIGNTKRKGGNAKAGNDAFYKQVLLHTLRKQNNPHPEQTLEEYVQSYQTEEEFEPYDISISRRQPKKRKIIVSSTPRDANLPYEKAHEKR
jgi:hypothetical protein